MSMLPLVAGMPLVLVEHVDRSPSIRMLKGTKVNSHSVELHPIDAQACRGQAEYVLQHIPICVYVQKPGVDWTIGKCKVRGLYPLKLKRAKWFLDKGRQFPRLGIIRRQLPIAPGFAVTVHSVQGKEEDPLCVDVCISEKCSKQTCYVALSLSLIHI